MPADRSENQHLRCWVHGGEFRGDGEDCSRRNRMDSGFAFIRCSFAQVEGSGLSSQGDADRRSLAVPAPRSSGRNDA